jgi:uncharacterized protein YbjQ (UPF0145 family)
MKKIVITTSALLALAFTPAIQAQENSPANGKQQMQRQGKGKRGGEMHQLMRSSMAIIQSEMKKLRDSNQDARQDNLEDLKGKSVAEIVDAIKARRQEHFDQAQEHFKAAFAKAEEYFKTEVEKLSTITEEQKARALERFKKIEQRHQEKRPEFLQEHFAFLDSLAADPNMTPQKLHEKIKERREELKQRFNEQRQQRKNQKGKRGNGGSPNPS